MTLESFASKDNRGDEAYGYAWKVDVVVEDAETKEAELLKWPAIATPANEARVTLINGMVATFPTQLGVSHGYASEKDSDDIAFNKVTASGMIQNASMDGIWS